MTDKSIKIYEVGPRDGLQNEKAIISTKDKLKLIALLSDSGLKFIEATSFVSPKWVPQMADHTDIMQALKTRKDGIIYAALVPNDTGMFNALACGVKEVAVFASASETFSQKNINCSIAQSLQRFKPIIKMAQDQNIRVRAYISCIAGCPYEGQVNIEKVTALSAKLYEMGCYEISLGDTIGIGHPDQISNIINSVKNLTPIENIALHCHDTHGRALDNIGSALDAGIRIFDSSIAGLGGCPYAEGASGNVATESVVAMLHNKGFETGVKIDKLDIVKDFIKTTLHIDQRDIAP